MWMLDGDKVETRIFNHLNYNKAIIELNEREKHNQQEKILLKNGFHIFKQEFQLI